MKSRVCGYTGLNLFYHNRTAFSINPVSFSKGWDIFRTRAAAGWFGTCLYLVLFQYPFLLLLLEVKPSFGGTALLKI